MLSSPRRPSSTMRIFSSAEWCRRVALRISRTVFSALSGMRLLACLIVAPQRGYDEPAILSYAISSFCPTSADGLHRRHQASLSSANGANDQPLPELALNLTQGMPRFSSSNRKLRRATSLKSHFSLGTRSLALSIRLWVKAVLGRLGNAPGNAPSCNNEIYH